MNILISACLLGVPCRYNGGSARAEGIARLSGRHGLVPVCPEQLGGLPTPRPPAERVGDRVLTQKGDDVTAAYRKGAAATLELARLLGCTHAVLKSRSPSCGCGRIYDGSFTGALTVGDGVTTALLRQAGLQVRDERHIGELLL